MTAKPDERRKDDPRVRQLMEDMRVVKDDLGAMKVIVAELSSDMATNTVLIQEVRFNTAGVVQFVQDSEEAFRLFNRMMTGLRWFFRKAVLPLLVVIAGIYAFTHEGRPPEWVRSWIDLFK